MTKDEALKLALEVLEEGVQGTRPLGVATLEAIATIKEALAQPEQYTTDAMKVRQAVAQALHDDVYAEELEQPEAKQSGTISITMPAPVAYLCENAVGHKYFRWKKPSSTYKPIPLYTTPPQRTWVGLTDEEIEQMGLSNYIKVVRETEAKLKDKNTNPAVFGTTQLEKPEAINAGIERTSRLRKAMDKEHEYMKYREAFPKREYVMPVDRNEVLEEVAKAVYSFKAFEKDTMDSFAAYIRSMKR